MNMDIDLPVHQFRKGDLISCLREAIAHHDIEAKQLTFEITESAAMDDIENTMTVFQDLTRISVTLSIDDSETGYSSLSYVRRLYITELKIDRFFVNEIDSCDDAQAIVDALIKMAHVLKLRIVAEGVENAFQCKMLAELGCNNFQGSLFVKPLPLDMMIRGALGEAASTSSSLAAESI